MFCSFVGSSELTNARKNQLEIVMKKQIIALALVSSAGIASAAFFFSADASVGSNGALTVAWDERGLGNENVTYNLTGSGSGVYACINGGGNHPQASNKVGPSPINVTSAPIKVKNGRIVSSLTVEPPSSGTLSCPSGQDPVLVCVSYSGLVLTDTTNQISITPTGTTSRTLRAVKGVSCD
jgi:hypothetical protein